MLAQASPNGFLRRAFESGATDVVSFPQSHDQLRFSMTKALARRSQIDADRSDRHSSFICVLGPKGGTGKTLTSCNLAIALAEMGQQVLIIDLDLQFGDVALCLGASPEKTMYDLILSGGSLDLEKLQAYVVVHPSGVTRSSRPSRPDQASVVTPDFLRDVYAIARAHYDFIVVDTPPGFTAEVIAAIDTSSDLVMVGMLDSLSLKNTKLGLETLQLMDYDRTKSSLSSTARTAVSASARRTWSPCSGRPQTCSSRATARSHGPSTRESRSSPPGRSRKRRRHSGRLPACSPGSSLHPAPATGASRWVRNASSSKGRHRWNSTSD